MVQKNTIVKGAFILTLTGFATRFIGFFYRIFLSRTFGEEGVGIYQLIFPVFALGFSLTCAGIETAISRCVAGKMYLGKARQAKEILYTGISLSVFLSILFLLILQWNAEFVATELLKEPRGEPLLLVLSYAFPFAAVHGCICGYYIGLKQTRIPALSQIIEQLVRVASVWAIYAFLKRSSGAPGIIVAVAGYATGEVASSLFCIWSVNRRETKKIPCRISFPAYFTNLYELLHICVPLTGSRVLLNLLQSAEAVSIPLRLQMFGFSVKDSLSIYGVLTGMALPCILFPSAITNAIACMLLPTIAEIQALDDQKEMNSIVKKVFACCFFLGTVCCFFLIITGSFIGNLLFHSQMAGQFIITLAWMCPFLYTNSNLISIINGLGHTTYSFLYNTISLLIRLCSVFLAIPAFGIRGYLWGLLGSQLALFMLCILHLKKIAQCAIFACKRTAKQ